MSREPAARSGSAGRAPAGFSLVEALVALAVMATVALALIGLQAAGLRAARAAAQTRQQAAALRYETDLVRLVPPTVAGTCRGVHGAGTCTMTTACLDPVPGASDCQLRRTTVELSGAAGPRVTATTVGYAPLEAAPVGEPGAAEVETP